MMVTGVEKYHNVHVSHTLEWGAPLALILLFALTAFHNVQSRLMPHVTRTYALKLSKGITDQNNIVNRSK